MQAVNRTSVKSISALVFLIAILPLLRGCDSETQKSYADQNRQKIIKLSQPVEKPES